MDLDDEDAEVVDIAEDPAAEQAVAPSPLHPTTSPGVATSKHVNSILLHVFSRCKAESARGQLISPLNPQERAADYTGVSLSKIKRLGA
jgi:hypothetical protein